MAHSQIQGILIPDFSAVLTLSSSPSRLTQDSIYRAAAPLFFKWEIVTVPLSTEIRPGLPWQVYTLNLEEFPEITSGRLTTLNLCDFLVTTSGR